MAHTHESITEDLGRLLLNLDSLPCVHPNKEGLACARQHEGLGRDGRLKFWYGVDCKIPAKHFCDPCLASWMVAVARNLVINDGRRTLRKELR